MEADEVVLFDKVARGRSHERNSSSVKLVIWLSGRNRETAGGGRSTLGRDHASLGRLERTFHVRSSGTEVHPSPKLEMVGVPTNLGHVLM
jgi:hypothetical protein